MAHFGTSSTLEIPAIYREEKKKPAGVIFLDKNLQGIREYDQDIWAWNSVGTKWTAQTRQQTQN